MPLHVKYYIGLTEAMPHCHTGPWFVMNFAVGRETPWIVSNDSEPFVHGLGYGLRLVLILPLIKQRRLFTRCCLTWGCSKVLGVNYSKTSKRSVAITSQALSMCDNNNKKKQTAPCWSLSTAIFGMMLEVKDFEIQFRLWLAREIRSIRSRHLPNFMVFFFLFLTYIGRISVFSKATLGNILLKKTGWFVKMLDPSTILEPMRVLQ